ncbi:hypothetical protein B566_EDAN012691 [Ephemera danica]|nr:hypothetical protein B566_EDAN012691 [Ephemera danica]
MLSQLQSSAMAQVLTLLASGPEFIDKDASHAAASGGFPTRLGSASQIPRPARQQGKRERNLSDPEGWARKK